MNGGDSRSMEAAQAAALRAENARQRRVAAATRQRELHQAEYRGGESDSAAERAARAARAAERSLARAIEADERSAVAHE